MKYKNNMNLEFDSVSQNESFARIVVAAFVAPLDPTIEQLDDIKTAVSEAVTNCIIHGYEGRGGKIRLTCSIADGLVSIEIADKGVGIMNIEEAMEPLYTSKPELERSGMGFAFMDAFMEKLNVVSEIGEGTTVKMEKRIKSVESLSSVS